MNLALKKGKIWGSEEAQDLKQCLLFFSVTWIWGSTSQAKYHISDTAKDTYFLKYIKNMFTFSFFHSVMHTASNHNVSVLEKFPWRRGKEGFIGGKCWLSKENKTTQHLPTTHGF